MVGLTESTRIPCYQCPSLGWPALCPHIIKQAWLHIYTPIWLYFQLWGHGWKNISRESHHHDGSHREWGYESTAAVYRIATELHRWVQAHRQPLLPFFLYTPQVWASLFEAKCERILFIANSLYILTFNLADLEGTALIGNAYIHSRIQS